MSRAEIEDIRGVDVGGIARGLLERKLIKIIGKKDVPGKPLLYGTTPKFLTMFGLKSLKDLPALEDIEQLSKNMEPLLAELPLEYSQSTPDSEPVPDTIASTESEALPREDAP